MPYVDWDIGEAMDVSNADGVCEAATLTHVGRVSVEVRLFDSDFCLPLFELPATLTAPQHHRLAHLRNVVSYGGWTVASVATRGFMDRDGFNRSSLCLRKDARLWIGTDEAWCDETAGFGFPVSGCDWELYLGWLGKGRPNAYGYHVGIDVYAPRGVPIVSASHGRVVALRRFDAERSEDDYWGNMVAIADDQGHVFNYCHMHHLPDELAVGVDIARGQHLGGVGRSGFESMPFGAHLHFEVYTVRPGTEPGFGYEMTPQGRRLPPEMEGRIAAVNPLPYLVGEA